MVPSSTHDVAVGLPLVIAAVMTVGSTLIHGLALVGIVHFVRGQHLHGHAGVRFWEDLATVSAAILLAGAAHVVEVLMWAVSYILCGEFSGLAAAFYSSAMLYTSLGYGDVVMSSSWKLLGPFETADGMLMFGVSGAIVIAVIQLMVRTRFRDLPNL